MGTAGLSRRVFGVLVVLASVMAMAVAPASADPVGPPATPTGLVVSDHPCDGDPIFAYDAGNYLLADVSHVEENYGLGARFTIWDVDQPEHRYVGSDNAGGAGYVRVGVPPDFFADARTYEWTVRAERKDGQVSPESAPCRFTTDFTPPAVPPLVTSTDYPENGGAPGTGGGGIAGRFTFSGGGDEDVVGFRYWGSGYDGRVEADHPGGTASVDVAPGSEGNSAIQVFGVDRAGHRSDTTTYRFYVRLTAPDVTSTPQHGAVGVPRVFTFTPRPDFDPVVEYTYRFKDGEAVTIPAAADGTASVTHTPAYSYDELTVFGRTADGTRTGTVFHPFNAVGGYPVVSSDVYPEWESGGGVGVPGVFTFTPAMPDVVEYQYWIGSEVSATVPAAPDGTFSFTFTPTTTGWHDLWVRSRTSAGIESPYNEAYYFYVAD